MGVGVEIVENWHQGIFAIDPILGLGCWRKRGGVTAAIGEFGFSISAFVATVSWGKL